MNKNSALFLSLLSVSTMLTGAPSWASVKKIGVLAAEDNNVSILRASGERVDGKVGDAIYLNDRISTDGTGKAQLVFEDRSTITIKEKAELLIDTFVYDPNAQTGTMTVSSVKGAFRFIGGALSKNNAVNVKTPVATIGIRGGIADTQIGADGKTNAVFHFGNEMSMTNQNGEVVRVSTPGSGLGLDSANATPRAMSAAEVRQVTTNNAVIQTSGGGANVTPTAETIKPSLQSLESETQQPTSPPAPEAQSMQGTVGEQLLTEATQAPAPIEMVMDSNASLLTNMLLPEPMGATERQVAQQQAASNDPQVLAQIVQNDAAFIDLITPPTAPRDTPPPSAPIVQDVPPTVSNDPEVLVPPTEEPISIASPVTAPVTVPVTVPQVTAPTNIMSGGYILHDGVSNGNVTYNSYTDEGDLTNITATTFGNAWNVETASDRSMATRSFTLPELTTGYNAPTTMDIDNDGTLEPRSVKGFKTNGGAFSYYHMDNGVTNDPDRIVHAMIGRDIFDNATDGLTAYNQAALHSRNTNTNGFTFYDFIPPVRENIANQVSGFTHGLEVNLGNGTPFNSAAHYGMAINWNGAASGTVVGGTIKWLSTSDNDPSNMMGMFGGRQGPAHADNDSIFAGKHIYFRPENWQSGGYTQNAAWGVDGLFANATGPIEALSMDVATAQFSSGKASDSIATTLNGTRDEVHRQRTAAILKEGIANNSTAIRQVNGPVSTSRTIQNGYMGGVVMEYIAGRHAPVLYASTSKHASIDVTKFEQSAGFGTNTSPYITKLNGQRHFFDDATAGGTQLKKDNTSVIFARFAEGTEHGTYVNNKMYAMRQVEGRMTSPTGSGTNATQTSTSVIGTGLVLSGEYATDARSNLASAYHCVDCQYTQWGVWGGELPTAGQNQNPAKRNYALMIPFMTGEATLTTALPTSGTASYKGEAYGTAFDGNANVLPTNIAGTMDASVNFNGTNTQLTNFTLDFGTVRGLPLKLERDPNFATVIATDLAQFDPGLGTRPHLIPDHDVVLRGVPGATDAIGGMVGGFYGPQAQEIGGGFAFKRTTDNLTGAGIYFGKQRSH